MRIGIGTGYWPWFTFERQVEMAVLADELGFDSIWASEGWGQDVVSFLGYVAARTEHVRLGTAIMQIPARPPTTAAMAAASLDVISGGRVSLGLGLSGPQVSEGWYGVPFARPLARTRAYVEAIRRALSGERMPVQLPDGVAGTGLGKELRLLARPVQQQISIFLGVTSPKAIEQCAEIADGWLGAFVDPSQRSFEIDALVAGLAAAGRPREELTVATLTPTSVAPTIAEAIANVKPWLVMYLGAVGAREKNFYVELADRYGYGNPAREVQAKYLDGDRTGAAAALPDELVQAVSIATDPAGLPDRVAAYREAGVDLLIAIPGGDELGTIRALAGAH